jgi:hypothetical protein
MPGNGRSWSVPVYVLNGRHTRQGLVDSEDPAPPMNASPHPVALPYLTVIQEHHFAAQLFNQQHADQAWEQGEVQFQAEGWGNWPAVPEVFQGFSMRQMFGYDGPSMMDGVETQYNITDDALDAWNDHVAEVERAADAVLTGESTTLLFIRAPGVSLNVAVPGVPSFAQFLEWMHQQVNTRTILPADPMEAVLFFRNLVAQVAAAVLNAEFGSLSFTRQLSGHELMLLHTAAANRVDVTPPSSVIITELPEDELSQTVGTVNTLAEDNSTHSEIMEPASADLSVQEPWLNAISQSDAELETLGFLNVPGHAVSDEVLDLAAVTPLLNDSEASSSMPIISVAAPDAKAAVRPRGRPRKIETPKVEVAVRRSPRLHNGGMSLEMPIQCSRHRASSVPRAAAPATLQIAEMQRMGVEQCLIDPAELTEERLLQDRQA